LFAFVLVSGGVLLLPREAKQAGKFQLPYINGKIIVPLLTALFIYVFRARLQESVKHIGHENYQEVLFFLFVLIAVVLSILTFIRNFSFIPIMGVLSCLYLMIEIPAVSWTWFFVWMLLGLLIYFLYGYRNSKLAKR
jgi:heme/copper-type cytochrome/quinol oxidase subunit 2